MKRDSTLLPTVEYSLHAAHCAISAQINPLEQQQIPVTDALFRVSTASLPAFRAKPSYNQSTRDGFALSSEPLSVCDGKAIFQLAGEVAAGSTKAWLLKPGEAIRIMTGAMVPTDCVRVVPFEVCHDSGQTVEVPTPELSRRQQHIRYQGSDVKKGDVLVAAGTRLLPDHLLVLAENGCQEILVHKQPKAAIICTGSELVEVGQTLQPGRKVSGNGVLLAALLHTHGASCAWSVTVGDTVELIVKQIQRILAEKPDMIVTTGGMGPGKFDLMEQVFARLGGTPVYNSLQVRPGKSTLFGMLGQIPFFGLPGPPPAVRILFHELIVPALNTMQGWKKEHGAGTFIDAVLESSVSLKQTGHLNLKGAVARLVAGRVQVRPAGRLEPINAIMHLEDKEAVAKLGEQVKIRFVEPLHGLTG